MSEVLPKLRPVEAIPVQQGRTQLVALRDPLGIAEGTIALSPRTFFLLQMFDGRHSVREAQTAYVRQFGELVRSDEIRGLVEQLDEALILDTPRFAEAVQGKLEEFRRSGVRESNHHEPEATAESLNAELDGYCAGVEAAAPPDGAGAPIVGAIAPHIDFARGGRAYAEAYAPLRAHCPADLFVILGTDHYGMHRFALTRADFRSPLGAVRTCRDLVDGIAEAYAGDAFAGELAHRTEHTIEFQVLWLQHVFAEREFEIVPILCGSLGELMQDDTSPAHSLEITSLVSGLRDVLARSGRQVCLIASADLSHIGPDFGDQQRATPVRLATAERRDRELLERALALDPDGVFAAVAADRNATNVCGLGPVYVMAAILTGATGQLIGYHSAPVPGSPSAVTFASAVFWSQA